MSPTRTVPKLCSPAAASCEEYVGNKVRHFVGNTRPRPAWLTPRRAPLHYSFHCPTYSLPPASTLAAARRPTRPTTASMESRSFRPHNRSRTRTRPHNRSRMRARTKGGCWQPGGSQCGRAQREESGGDTDRNTKGTRREDEGQKLQGHIKATRQQGFTAASSAPPRCSTTRVPAGSRASSQPSAGQIGEAGWAARHRETEERSATSGCCSSARRCD